MPFVIGSENAVATAGENDDCEAGGFVCRGFVLFRQIDLVLRCLDVREMAIFGDDLASRRAGWGGGGLARARD